MSETQALEIMNALDNLPTKKVAEVRDYAMFIRERYGKQETVEAVDYSDEWTDEDLRDFTAHSLNYAAAEFDEPDAAQKKTPAEILAEIAALPIEGKTDPFSGNDHDEILYGKK